MDIPLLSEVKDLLRVQKALGGEPEYLLNNMTQAQTHHDFAACYIALWEYVGAKPEGMGANAFIDASVKLAMQLRDSIHHALGLKLPEVSRNTKRSECYEPIQHQLTTKVVGGGGYVLGMSDAARNEAAAIRRKEGKGEYQGQRFIKPKRRFSEWDYTLMRHGMYS